MDHKPLDKLLVLQTALEYLYKQDEPKYYDPKGFHVGPREGHYFKPGEREAGGKEVEIVQAPEAETEIDQSKKPSKHPPTSTLVEGSASAEQLGTRYGRIVPRNAETGKPPTHLYRVMDKRQYDDAVEKGVLEPAPEEFGGDGRIHGAGKPNLQYADPKPTVLVAIEYSDDDGWVARQAGFGDITAATSNPIPISKVTVLAEGATGRELRDNYKLISDNLSPETESSEPIRIANCQAGDCLLNTHNAQKENPTWKAVHGKSLIDGKPKLHAWLESPDEKTIYDPTAFDGAGYVGDKDEYMKGTGAQVSYKLTSDQALDQITKKMRGEVQFPYGPFTADELPSDVEIEDISPEWDDARVFSAEELKDKDEPGTQHYKKKSGAVDDPNWNYRDDRPRTPEEIQIVSQWENLEGTGKLQNLSEAHVQRLKEWGFTKAMSVDDLSKLLVLETALEFMQDSSQGFLLQKSVEAENVVKVGDVDIPVELALDPAKGLSGRGSMNPGTGMLFSMPNARDFWMKDMKFPLDIVWINDRREVVDITENIPVPNSSFMPLYSPRRLSTYALEINGGEAKALGINIGDAVEINIS